MAVHDERWPDFDAFYRDVEPRIRRALVVACGVPEGLDAASAAMELGLARWDEVREMDNPAGYL